jgi:O-acetyl-ADP-ribose deacetylase (regulator of RNase III)
MPIIEVKGDLLASNCEIIAHGANCFHTFGSGIAKQIREQYPKAFEADYRTIKGSKEKLGSYSFADVSSDKSRKYIVNLYTQYTFGTDKVQLDYEALIKSLVHLKRLAGNNLKIGIPRIGCGLAGGDWNAVKAIINYVFHDKDIYVYSL